MSYGLQGYDQLDLEDLEVVGDILGAAKRAKLAKRGRGGRPAWRDRLAAGVPKPGYGHVNLPLRPDTNGGVFTSAVNVIGFEARPQKPFQGMRYVATVRRTGAAGVIILGSGIFIGTDLQQGELGEFDIEQFGPTAFDMSMEFVQAEPGVLIRLSCRANPAIAVGDSVAVSMQVLGNYVH